MQTFIKVLIVVFLICLFIITYMLNKRIKVDDNCEEDECNACNNLMCKRNRKDNSNEK